MKILRYVWNVAGLDINYQVSDPSHSFSNSGHGTSVSGVASARDQNSLGGRGGAPCAEVIGINLLEKSSFSGADEAQSQTHANLEISYFPTIVGDQSDSLWITMDLYCFLEIRSSKQLYKLDGMDWEKLLPGRQGMEEHLEVLQDAVVTDNSNYDSYANNPHVLAVCAVGTNGKKAGYSEKGANLWVCGHSQGNNNANTAYSTAITTTDATGVNGFNDGTKTASVELSNPNYTKNFNGTSSATPLVSAVVALLLNKYPDLSVRDVREIIAKSARKNDPLDSDWTVNPAGYNINHKYGFGTVDAANALAVASNWSRISGTWKKFEVSVAGPGAAIPDNNATGVSANIIVAGSGISKVEHIEFTTGTNHTYFPDLTIELTSPNSTLSILAEKHNCYTNSSLTASCPTGGSGISNFTGTSTFTLGSARHLRRKCRWDLVSQIQRSCGNRYR
jgi:proprotein convertase subtilisin/kexin type 2